MSDLPEPESDDPREQDHGELFRPSTRHLPPAPLMPVEKKVVYGFLAAAAAIAVAFIALGR